MVLAVTESFKFLAGMWFFVRHFIQAFIAYIQDTEKKLPAQHQLKGKGLKEKEKIPDDLPSIIDIKKALPKHCFQPKISTSTYYAIKDFILIGITYIAMIYLQEVQNVYFRVVTMIIYYGVQGTLFTAIFVIGHDCGHGSFSNNDLLNNVIGNIWHGFLLTPYYMWKLSHKQHHRFNANFDKDEVFYPVKKTDCRSEKFTLPMFGFGTGWLVYLFNGYSPRNVNHFNIFGKMFTGNVVNCAISLVVNIAWAYCLYLYAAQFGFWALFNHYCVPLFIFASYMVTITFLHHSEVNIPWYPDDKWDFVRGQLSTIDRHYGIVHNVIHNIGTHQMHHMFIKIPHYHLEEATAHFRKAFPHLVKTCDEPIIPSFARMFRKYDRQCVMDDGTKIHYYK